MLQQALVEVASKCVLSVSGVGEIDGDRQGG